MPSIEDRLAALEAEVADLRVTVNRYGELIDLRADGSCTVRLNGLYGIRSVARSTIQLDPTGDALRPTTEETIQVPRPGGEIREVECRLVTGVFNPRGSTDFVRPTVADPARNVRGETCLVIQVSGEAPAAITGVIDVGPDEGFEALLDPAVGSVRFGNGAALIGRRATETGEAAWLQVDADGLEFTAGDQPLIVPLPDPNRVVHQDGRDTISVDLPVGSTHIDLATRLRRQSRLTGVRWLVVSATGSTGEWSDEIGIGEDDTSITLSGLTSAVLGTNRVRLYFSTTGFELQLTHNGDPVNVVGATYFQASDFPLTIAAVDGTFQVQYTLRLAT